MKPLSFEWQPIEPPRAPCAVFARGAAAHQLALRVVKSSDEQLAALRGIAGDDFLLILGEGDSLPWVDGVQYLGRDDDAPSMLLPTTQTVSVPLPLFECALLRRARTEIAVTPLAVLSDYSVLSLAGARPVSREVLQRWYDNAVGNETRAEDSANEATITEAQT